MSEPMQGCIVAIIVCGDASLCRIPGEHHRPHWMRKHRRMNATRKRFMPLWRRICPCEPDPWEIIDDGITPVIVMQTHGTRQSSSDRADQKSHLIVNHDANVLEAFFVSATAALKMLISWLTVTPMPANGFHQWRG